MMADRNMSTPSLCQMELAQSSVLLLQCPDCESTDVYCEYDELDALHRHTCSHCGSSDTWHLPHCEP